MKSTEHEAINDMSMEMDEYLQEEFGGIDDDDDANNSEAARFISSMQDFSFAATQYVAYEVNRTYSGKNKLQMDGFFSPEIFLLRAGEIDDSIVIQLSCHSNDKILLHIETEDDNCARERSTCVVSVGEAVQLILQTISEHETAIRLPDEQKMSTSECQETGENDDKDLVEYIAGFLFIDNNIPALRNKTDGVLKLGAGRKKYMMTKWSNGRLISMELHGVVIDSSTLEFISRLKQCKSIRLYNVKIFPKEDRELLEKWKIDMSSTCNVEVFYQ